MGQGLRPVVKISPPYGRGYPSIHHPGAGNNKKWERGRVKSLVSGLSMTGSPNRPEKADGQSVLLVDGTGSRQGRGGSTIPLSSQ